MRSYRDKKQGKVRQEAHYIGKNVPRRGVTLHECSCYIVYDEQYVSIYGKERYRALLKGTKTGRFLEKMTDNVTEYSIINFRVNSLKQFNVPSTIYITYYR